MAQNENYSQVDLRVGTEEQFNAKVGTLPAGTLFGVTDATVSKADLSTDLKNEINGKINKPANPTSDSAVVINSSGAISTKPLTSITGKSEVYIGTPDPTGGEILWINPDGTSGGGKLYQHIINIGNGEDKILSFSTYSSKINLTYDDLKNINKLDAFYLSNYTTRYIVASIDIIISPNSTKTTFAYATKYPIDESEYGFEELPSNIYSLSDKVTEL